jgi:hypothetical protein
MSRAVIADEKLWKVEGGGSPTLEGGGSPLVVDDEQLRSNHECLSMMPIYSENKIVMCRE